MQQDEGFHEIQLSGKQLVFLCMATTVVSVLIFLCGVLVGRGVRAERLSAASAPLAADAEPATQVASDTPIQESVPLSSQEPPPPSDDLSYSGRLEDQAPAKESLKKPEPPAKDTVTAQPVLPAPAPERTPPPAPKPEPTTGTQPSRPTGFMVQVASLRDRSEADSMVKRLSGKGYPAFVLEPAAAGAAPVFRVRIGGYATRAEAEQIGHKLEKEEQFQPWITR